FGLHLVARITRPRNAIGPGFRVGTAALDHEAFDDPVKGSAVIEAVAGQLLEVFHGLGGDIGPEGKSHVAIGGGNDGDFVRGGGGITHENGQQGSGRGVPQDRTRASLAAPPDVALPRAAAPPPWLLSGGWRGSPAD